MKIIIGIGAVVIIVLAVLLFTLKPAGAPSTVTGTADTETATGTSTLDTTDTPGTTGRIANPDQPTSSPTPVGKLKADTFTGTLEEVNTGCFADGECYVVVDGKHITTTMGWSRDTVGTIIGVPSFGDLEAYIGQPVEVYAQVNADATYTLYGSEGFYVKALGIIRSNPLPPPLE